MLVQAAEQPLPEEEQESVTDPIQPEALRRAGPAAAVVPPRRPYALLRVEGPCGASCATFPSAASRPASGPHPDATRPSHVSAERVRPFAAPGPANSERIVREWMHSPVASRHRRAMAAGPVASAGRAKLAARAERRRSAPRPSQLHPNEPAVPYRAKSRAHASFPRYRGFAELATAGEGSQGCCAGASPQHRGVILGLPPGGHSIPPAKGGW